MLLKSCNKKKDPPNESLSVHLENPSIRLQVCCIIGEYLTISPNLCVQGQKFVCVFSFYRANQITLFLCIPAVESVNTQTKRKHRTDVCTQPVSSLSPPQFFLAPPQLKKAVRRGKETENWEEEMSRQEILAGRISLPSLQQEDSPHISPLQPYTVEHEWKEPPGLGSTHRHTFRKFLLNPVPSFSSCLLSHDPPPLL